MKEAKRHKGLQRCGNCAMTIKLRHDAGKVACTAHLTVVSVDHVGECGEYEPTSEQTQLAAAGAGPAASSTDSAP